MHRYCIADSTVQENSGLTGVLGYCEGGCVYPKCDAYSVPHLSPLPFDRLTHIRFSDNKLIGTVPDHSAAQFPALLEVYAQFTDKGNTLKIL